MFHAAPMISSLISFAIVGIMCLFPPAFVLLVTIVMVRESNQRQQRMASDIAELRSAVQAMTGTRPSEAVQSPSELPRTADAP